VSALLADSPMGSPSPKEIQRAAQEQEVPEGWTLEQWQEVRNLFRQVLDATFLHGLGDVLRSPYSLPNDDYSIHAARHKRGGRDLDAGVLCGVNFPTIRGSMLLDSRGRSADLIPEAILIQQELMKGSTRVRETGGAERPYRKPSKRRSLDATDRFLSLRERFEYRDMRKILRDWRGEVQTATAKGQALKPLAGRYQERVNRLAPGLESTLGELAAMLWIVIEEPAPAPMSRLLADSVVPGPGLFHLQDYGPIPALCGSVVRRRRGLADVLGFVARRPKG